MKHYSTCLAIVLFASYSFSQDTLSQKTEYPRAYLRIAVGESLQGPIGSSPIATQPGGFEMGVEGTIPLRGLLHLQVGAYASKKLLRYQGTLFQPGGSTSQATRYQPLSYFVAPLLLRVETKGKLRIWTEAGGYCALLYLPTSSEYRTGTIGKLRRYDVGGVAGAGVAYNLHERYIFSLGTRVTAGFVNVWAPQDPPLEPARNLVADHWLGVGVFVNRS